MQLVKMAMSKGDQRKSHQSHSSAGTADNHNMPKTSQSKTSLQIQAESTLCGNESHSPATVPQLPDCCEIQDPESLHVNTYTDVERGRSPSRLPLFVNTSSPVSVVHSASNIETALSKFSCHISNRSSVNNFVNALSQENESSTAYSENTEDGSMKTSTDEETECFYARFEPNRHLGSSSVLGRINQADVETTKSDEGDTMFKDESNVFDENMNVQGIQDNNLVPEPSSHHQNFLLTQTATDMSYNTKLLPGDKSEQSDKEFMQENSADLMYSFLKNMKMFESALTGDSVTHTENSHQQYFDARLNSNQHSHERSVKMRVVWSPNTNSGGISNEPPIRTSLALKDRLKVLPGLVQPLPQHHFISKASVTPSPPPYTFKPIALSDDSEDSVDGSEEQIFSETDSDSDLDLPEFRVFQHCNGINRKCVSNDAVNDCIENGRNICDVNETGTTGLNFDCNVNNVSVTMEEPDMFVRLLPSLHSCSDFILSHMADEEVAMIMQRNDIEENEDEELLSFDMVDGEMSGSAGRPTNPVACILECGGNEHFLPIVSDVFQDSVTPE